MSEPKKAETSITIHFEIGTMLDIPKSMYNMHYANVDTEDHKTKAKVLFDVQNARFALCDLQIDGGMIRPEVFRFTMQDFLTGMLQEMINRATQEKKNAD